MDVGWIITAAWATDPPRTDNVNKVTVAFMSFNDGKSIETTEQACQLHLQSVPRRDFSRENR